MKASHQGGDAGRNLKVTRYIHIVLQRPLEHITFSYELFSFKNFVVLCLIMSGQF